MFIEYLNIYCIPNIDVKYCRCSRNRAMKNLVTHVIDTVLQSLI